MISKFIFKLLKQQEVMKKRILITITLLFSIMVFSISTSCNQNSSKKDESKSDDLEDPINEQEISSGEVWLKSIFECDNGNGYCFPDEKKVLTERYYEFFIESLAIYEYPDYETENEQIAAEKAYKNKWKDIYPLGEEVWAPFGRGNGIGAGEKVENVSISRISDLKYTVLIDYGEGSVFSNDVVLIRSGDAFLIDYLKTDLIE